MTPQEAILNHERNKNVLFYEDEHKYEFITEDGTKEQWYGITSWIKEFHEKFDRDGISKFVASRDRRTQEEVLAEWDKKRDDAIEYGNHVHKLAEDYINDGLIIDDEEDLACIIEAEGKLGYRSVLSEWVIYDERLKRCSAIDWLAFNPENDKFVIMDFKTNKEIKYEGYNGKMMHYPCEMLPDSNYYHYCLQLSIYKKIVREQYDLPVQDEMFILYIRQGEYELLPVFDMGHIVDLMYEHNEYLNS
ncbi:hypothetical protein ACKGJO_06620 [Gracilimonas sp. Q87]|uniref:hypothetical protein n=1 Tax=Gracilimonas sp. Q87 TaxID=3384766 RepID=UPI0039841714